MLFSVFQEFHIPVTVNHDIPSGISCSLDLTLLLVGKAGKNVMHQ